MSAALVGAVFQTFDQALHRYLVRRLSNVDTARDLAQEVYERLLRVPSDRLIKAPRAYAFRIAANLVYELRARERKCCVKFDSRLVEIVSEGKVDPMTAQPCEVANFDGQLESLLAQLPPLQASMLVMKKGIGLSLSEIAQQLGLSVHTVKKYLPRAVKACRCGSSLGQRGHLQG